MGETLSKRGRVSREGGRKVGVGAVGPCGDGKTGDRSNNAGNGSFDLSLALTFDLDIRPVPNLRDLPNLRDQTCPQPQRLKTRENAKQGTGQMSRLANRHKTSGQDRVNIFSEELDPETRAVEKSRAGRCDRRSARSTGDSAILKKAVP
jgi:hypothetical protein